MSDMLVKLYDLKEERQLYESLEEKGIRIKRALGLDTSKVLDFIGTHFGSEGSWGDESRVALLCQPSNCFIAVKNKKIVGFCCFDATYKDFVGPLGVLKEERRQGIGEALLRRCLLAMREAGYGYAIIGWAAPNAMDSYRRWFGAQVIENSHPGIYANMVEME